MPNLNSAKLVSASSQYLSITDAAQTGLDITGDFTIEAWIKLAQLPSMAGVTLSIVSKFYSATNQRSYQFSISNNNNSLSCSYSDDGTLDADSGTAANSNTVLTSADVGKWIHVAVTVDVSEKTFKFYKNGEDIGATNNRSFSTSVFNGTAPFLIGAAQIGESGFFNGIIDDVRVWNDIRTAQEIAANYTKELVGNEANLVGYWKLNNSLNDATANANHLTNNNSATFPAGEVPFTGTEFALF